MKTLKAKERAKIYRAATERIETECLPWVCPIIKELAGFTPFQYVFMREVFPEFYLFKPDVNEGWLGWWDNKITEPRMLALLFSEQIALDSK